MNTFRKMMELTSFLHTYEDLAIDETAMDRCQNGAIFVWQVRKTGTYLFPLNEMNNRWLEWAEACNETWPSAAWFLIEKNRNIQEIPAAAALELIRRSVC